VPADPRRRRPAVVRAVAAGAAGGRRAAPDPARRGGATGWPSTWRELVGADVDRRPHNWRWRRGRLHAFDFAAAALRPAAYDLGRLRFAACWDRPDLVAALLAGYGRDVTPAEQQFMDAMLPWRAVVAISLGVRHGRPEMVAHGHDVLARFGRC